MLDAGSHWAQSVYEYLMPPCVTILCTPMALNRISFTCCSVYVPIKMFPRMVPCMYKSV
jgi:hypothetical protein